MVGCPFLMSRRSKLATRAACLVCDKHTKSRVEASSRPFSPVDFPTYPTNPIGSSPLTRCSFWKLRIFSCRKLIASFLASPCISRLAAGRIATFLPPSFELALASIPGPHSAMPRPAPRGLGHPSAPEDARHQRGHSVDDARTAADLHLRHLADRHALGEISSHNLVGFIFQLL